MDIDTAKQLIEGAANDGNASEAAPYESNDILKRNLMYMFPKTEHVKEPRVMQTELVEKIMREIENGTTDITICAPTGSGKSILGLWSLYAAVKLSMCSAVYTSPLNILVDQLDNDFGGRYVDTLKGREHYPCVAGMENCAVGFCKQKKCTVTGQSPRNCNECADTDLDKFVSCACRDCVYSRMVSAFVNSDIGNTNFSIFLTGLCNKKKLVVIDECDNVEPFVRMQHSVTIQESIASTEYRVHMERLESIRDECIADIELYETGEPRFKLSVRDIIQKERMIASINTILRDYENKIAWCITHGRGTTQYQPVNVDRFLDKRLEEKTVIRMSATPYKMEKSTFIEVGSTFPAENRPWVYMPIGKMGRDHRQNTYQKIAVFLNTLKGKTVVHCHSYDIAESIDEYLHVIACGKAVFLQSRFGEFKRGNIVQAFKRSGDNDAILLSVNLVRGVDFPEDAICNNVIAKFPWLNHTDPLVQAKNSMYKNTRWQNAEIANTIMQAYGRLPRRPEKKSMCYIIDSDFNDPNGRGNTKSWYDKHKDIFYSWFTEAEVKKKA